MNEIGIKDHRTKMDGMVRNDETQVSGNTEQQKWASKFKSAPHTKITVTVIPMLYADF